MKTDKLPFQILKSHIILRKMVIYYCERLKSQNRVSTEHEADWQSWQAVSSSTGYK